MASQLGLLHLDLVGVLVDLGVRMLLISLLLDELGEDADHGLLKNVGEDHLLIVVAEVHQVLVDSFVLLRNDCHELLHLEDLDHAVAVDVPPLQVYADVH